MPRNHTSTLLWPPMPLATSNTHAPATTPGARAICALGVTLAKNPPPFADGQASTGAAAQRRAHRVLPGLAGPRPRGRPAVAARSAEQSAEGPIPNAGHVWDPPPPPASLRPCFRHTGIKEPRSKVGGPPTTANARGFLCLGSNLAAQCLA